MSPTHKPASLKQERVAETACKALMQMRSQEQMAMQTEAASAFAWNACVRVQLVAGMYLHSMMTGA